MEIGESKVVKVKFRGILFAIKVSRYELLYVVKIANAKTRQTSTTTCGKDELKDEQISMMKNLCHR